MRKIDDLGWPPQARQQLEAFLTSRRRFTRWQRDGQCLLYFLQFQKARGYLWDDFSQELLQSYADELRALPFKPVTLQDYRQPLRGWLRFLYRHAQVLQNWEDEVPQFRQPTSLRRTILSHEQILQLLQLPDLDCPFGLRDRAVYELAYSTAMRAGEMVAMDLGDVDLVAATVTVRRPKNGHDRVLPLTRWALHFLKAYLEQSRPRLANSGSGTALWLSRGGRRTYRKRFTERLKAMYQPSLGFPITMHLFRHACATHLLTGGADLRSVQILLGHLKLDSTQIYTHITPLNLLEMHRRCHPRSLSPSH